MNQKSRFTIANPAVRAVIVLALAVALVIAWRQAQSPRQMALCLAVSYAAMWAAYFLLARPPRAVRWPHFLLLHFSLAFTVGIFELGALLHVVDYRQVFGTAEAATFQRNLFRLDPELIYARRGNLHLHGNSRGGDFAALFDVPDAQRFTYDLRYDENGFRNSPGLQQADIVVIGDSFVEAPLVPDAELLTAHLGKLETATVANLGQIGIGPQQELIILRRYALALRPRIVVWVFFEGNDLVNIRGYERRMANWEAEVAASERFSERSFSRNGWRLFKRIYGLRLPPGQTRAAVFTTASSQRVNLYFLYALLPVQEKDVQSLEKLGEILTAANELCRKNHAQFLLVYAPTKFRVYRRWLQIAPGSLLATWSDNDLPDRVRGLAAKTVPDAGFLDMTPVLSEAAARGELVYYPDDSHWSPAGHRLAASAIHQWLRAHAVAHPSR